MKVKIKTWNELFNCATSYDVGFLMFGYVKYSGYQEERIPVDRIIDVVAQTAVYWCNEYRILIHPVMIDEFISLEVEQLPSANIQSVPRFVSGDDYAFDVKDIAGLVFKPESISSRLGQMTVTFKSSRYQVVDVTKSKFDAAIKILKDWVEAKENR